MEGREDAVGMFCMREDKIKRKLLFPLVPTVVGQ